eukprot:352610-Chlamydomonas_euryale.AAC.1
MQTRGRGHMRHATGGGVHMRDATSGACTCAMQPEGGAHARRNRRGLHMRHAILGFAHAPCDLGVHMRHANSGEGAHAPCNRGARVNPGTAAAAAVCGSIPAWLIFPALSAKNEP